jgi:hypothetical protein
MKPRAIWMPLLDDDAFCPAFTEPGVLDAALGFTGERGRGPRDMNYSMKMVTGMS